MLRLIKQIHEVYEAEKANELLKSGCILLEIYKPRGIPVFVLGSSVDPEEMKNILERSRVY